MNRNRIKASLAERIEFEDLGLGIAKWSDDLTIQESRQTVIDANAMVRWEQAGEEEL